MTLLCHTVVVFKQYGHGRNRGGRYGGRNKYKSFPMDGGGGGYTNPRGRGGGYTDPNAPGIAAPPSHGNGGSNRGGNGGGPAFYVVRCWKCNFPNPGQNTVCSSCWSRLCWSYYYEGTGSFRIGWYFYLLTPSALLRNVSLFFDFYYGGVVWEGNCYYNNEVGTPMLRAPDALRAPNATWYAIVFTCVLLSFFFLSPDRTFSPTYSKMKETKVVGISLSYRKKLRKTIGVPPGTLYTPHLTLIWGWNH